jgi:hypothetical protein
MWLPALPGLALLVLLVLLMLSVLNLLPQQCCKQCLARKAVCAWTGLSCCLVLAR